MLAYGFYKMLKWEKETKTKVVFENSIDVALVTFRLGELNKDSRSCPKKQHRKQQKAF